MNTGFYVPMKCICVVLSCSSWVVVGIRESKVKGKEEQKLAPGHAGHGRETVCLSVVRVCVGSLCC